MVSAVFKTVGCNLLLRQVRFLPLPKKTDPIMENDRLRNIPQVEKLLQSAELAGYVKKLGRGTVLAIIRSAVEEYRRTASSETDGLIPSIKKSCEEKRLRRLQRVINGTGIIIHTNLGRSPLPPGILKKMQEILSGYCNLEIEVASGGRGSRGGFAEELAAGVCGADDALFVNNNAAAVFLILSEFARGREVVVSRGEMMQIGGGFRIPDIMRQAEALLVEVGTTNITTIEDYQGAINENTAMIFSAHSSNYKIEGFTSSPSLDDLAALKTQRVMLVRDLGSGNLYDGGDVPPSFETTVARELSRGPDLICFSGDKLLGGCQAGIIAGNAAFIAAMRKNPIMRMIRPDKMTYFILQEILVCYQNGLLDGIPVWGIILGGKRAADRRISRLVRSVRNPAGRSFLKKTKTMCAFGGGSMPGAEMESSGLAVSVPGFSADAVYRYFSRLETPVVGIISEGRFLLDFSTVLDEDVPILASAIEKLASEKV